eukprot:CFRG0769T1
MAFPSQDLSVTAHAGATVKKKTPCARWRQIDDVQLITSMQQLESVALVHNCTRFSRTYSLVEVEERWRILLHNEHLSKIAQEGLVERLLEGAAISYPLDVQFSKDEQVLLQNMDTESRVSNTSSELAASTSSRTSCMHAGGNAMFTGRSNSNDKFQALLEENRLVFHPTRSAKDLERHAAELKLFGLYGRITNPGTVQSSKRQKNLSKSDSMSTKAPKSPTVSDPPVPSFQDYESALVMQSNYGMNKSSALPIKDECRVVGCRGTSNAGKSTSTKNTSNESNKRSIQNSLSNLPMEMSMADRHDKHTIRKLEKLTDSWQWNLLNESKVHPSSKLRMLASDVKTLAEIRGKKIEYRMTTKMVYIGRSNCDVNLSVEGPSQKISRLQGAIRLKSNMRFYLYNYGKHAMYVNGVPVNKGERLMLNHQAIIEVYEFSLLFSINLALIADLCYDVINSIVKE